MKTIRLLALSIYLSCSSFIIAQDIQYFNIKIRKELYLLRDEMRIIYGDNNIDFDLIQDNTGDNWIYLYEKNVNSIRIFAYACICLESIYKKMSETEYLKNEYMFIINFLLNNVKGVQASNGKNIMQKNWGQLLNEKLYIID